MIPKAWIGQPTTTNLGAGWQCERRDPPSLIKILAYGPMLEFFKAQVRQVSAIMKTFTKGKRNRWEGF